MRPAGAAISGLFLGDTRAARIVGFGPSRETGWNKLRRDVHRWNAAFVAHQMDVIAVIDEA
ncbi:MAG TPA: hypothetical protein VFJ55_01740 [Chthoniobacterales bacterium]|nr:hypothetical protein [Chthoniobacterales bacterium]